MIPLARSNVFPARTVLDYSNKADKAYDQLREMIINGELQSSEPLCMQKLSQHLKLGLTPIREALLRLQTQRFVVNFSKRGGLRVRLISLKEATDLYDFARIVLCQAVAVAVPRSPGHPCRGAPGGADAGLRSAAVQLEDAFTEVATGSTNLEIVAAIRNFNDRTRLIRLIEVENAPREQFVKRTNELAAAVQHQDAARILDWLEGYFRRMAEILPDLVRSSIAHNHVLLQDAS